MSKYNYAVIIDEAHSSQTGDSAIKLRAALGKNEDYGTEDIEEIINKIIEAKRPPKNISYFAFTATSKAKTIEMFGRKPSPTQKPVAFHEYSMKQAIEERFIEDVLKRFTPYKAFYKIAKSIEENPEFDKRRAVRALTKYIKLHPYQIGQKVEIIIEHFRHYVMPKIGGKAKAMVVADSRQKAVRYHEAFKKYILDKGYNDIKALVAFSGSVIDEDFPNKEFNEANMNVHLKGRDIKEAFASEEYQILIVANKFQTGFDQPLLHTMYVDKKLSGVAAVQTLSRLNRTHPKKQDTFILDFVNEPESIKEAFEPYYKNTELEAETDPNFLYDINKKLGKYNIFYKQEVEAFVKEYTRKNAIHNQAALHSHIDPAVDRYNMLDNDKQNDFKDSLKKFIRLYDFICMIVSFSDSDLEKLSIFGRFLIRKLPYDPTSEKIDNIDPYVALESYRMEKRTERRILLKDNKPLKPVSKAGTGKPKYNNKIILEELIAEINDLFAGDLSENDKIDFTTSVVNKVLENNNLRKQAKNNSKENFKHGDYSTALQDAIITSIEKQGDVASQVLSDKHKMTMLSNLLLDLIYNALKNDAHNVVIHSAKK